MEWQLKANNSSDSSHLPVVCPSVIYVIHHHLQPCSGTVTVEWIAVNLGALEAGKLAKHVLLKGGVYFVYILIYLMSRGYWEGWD